MQWTVVYLNDAVRAEVACLSPELRAKFRRIVELMRSKGLEQVREPYVKHLEGRLWEMTENHRPSRLRDGKRPRRRDAP